MTRYHADVTLPPRCKWGTRGVDTHSAADLLAELTDPFAPIPMFARVRVYRSTHDDCRVERELLMEYAA